MFFQLYARISVELLRRVVTYVTIQKQRHHTMKHLREPCLRRFPRAPCCYVTHLGGNRETNRIREKEKKVGNTGTGD